MNKSVYSLVLSDDVIRAVDRLAYRSGSSRSAMINQILADHVSMLTPEKRISDIFQRVAQLAAGNELFQLSPASGNMLNIKSAINYKYNPTIRYSVEIQMGESSYIGEFKAISRSQSGDLLKLLDSFFHLWFQLEARCLEQGELQAEIASGRMRRRLLVAKAGEIHDSQQLGDAIANYIHLFDSAMNQYFTQGEGCIAELEGMYRVYLAGTPVVI